MLTIVGNKTDLEEKRQVSTEEGKAMAEELGSMFIETSAKLGDNVKELFTDLARKLPGVANDSQGEPSQGAEEGINK